MVDSNLALNWSTKQVLRWKQMHQQLHPHRPAPCRPAKPTSLLSLSRLPAFGRGREGAQIFSRGVSSTWVMGEQSVGNDAPGGWPTFSVELGAVSHCFHLFWAFPHLFCFELSSSSIFYLRLYCWVKLSWSSFYLPTKSLVAMMNHEELNYKIGWRFLVVIEAALTLKMVSLTLFKTANLAAP